jgi:hypothetical protein
VYESKVDTMIKLLHCIFNAARYVNDATAQLWAYTFHSQKGHDVHPSQ